MGESCHPVIRYTFFALLALSIVACWLYIFQLFSNCQKKPGLGLEDVRIRDMVVYQNSTTDTAWQVRSDINVNLTMWNTNTMNGCFTTYRRVVVHVYFEGQLLLQQEVPLGFDLKSRGKRPVVLDLQGDGYKVQRDLGSLLRVELRNASAVGLQFTFKTRFSRNDDRTVWMGMCCDLVAKVTLNSSSQLNSTGGLVWSSCKPC